MQLNESLPDHAVLAAAPAAPFPKSERQNTLTPNPASARRVSRGSRRTPRSAELQQLTPREYEVLMHLSKGLRYKEIADRLGISQGTLHFFVRNLYAKLRVHSRTEAVVKLLNH